MANQIIIDIGAMANDGTGDPLRTAFGYVNQNFSNVWATGVANSNIQFSGNRILTVNTNGNLILAPNGTGKVQANVDIVPNISQAHSLGALDRRWNTVYSRYLNVSDEVDFNGDVIVSGNLTVQGDTIQIGNIVTDTKTIQLANTAVTGNAANGSGITVGANDNIATMLYNSAGNVWNFNIGITTAGNISGSLVAPGGNGQVLYNKNGIIGASPFDFNFDESTYTLYVVTGSFSGNAQTGVNALYAGVPGFTALGSDIQAQFTGNVDNYTQVNFQNINASPQASGDYIITADNGNDSTHFINLGMTSSTWDGSQLNSLGNALAPNSGYLYVQDGSLVIGTKVGSTANVMTFNTDGTITVPGNVVPVGNNTQSLGNATNQWSDLWVSNATIYFNSVPLTLTQNNVLTIGGEPILSNDSDTNITTTGNIIANNVTATEWVYGNLGVGTQQIQFTDAFNPLGNSVNILLSDGDLVYESTLGSSGGFRPSTDNSESLGKDGFRWDTIYGNVINATTFIGDGSQLSNVSSTGNLEIVGTTIGIAAGAPESNITVGSANAALVIEPDSGSPIVNLYTQETSSQSFFESSDYTTGTYITGGSGGEIALTGAPNVENFLNNLNGYNIVSMTINGTDTVPYDGASYGGGSVTLFTTTAPAVDPTTVTNIEFNLVFQNRFFMDPDEGDMGIYIGDYNFDIESQRDVRILARDDFSVESYDGFDLRSRATSGGIRLYTDYGNNQHQWQFSSNGNLTLPQGGIINEGPSPSFLGAAVTITPANGSDADQQLKIYPTIAEGNHLHLTTGNLYNTELYVGDDNLYVKLANTGDVVINSNDGLGNSAQWTFGVSGNLTAPGNIDTTGNITAGNIIAPASTANTQILFNNAGVVGGSAAFTFDTNGNTLSLANSSSTLKVADIQTPTAGVSLRLIPASGITYSYGNFLPLFANTYDLGGSGSRWNSVFANVANVSSLAVTGTASATSITLSGTGTAVNASSGNILTNKVTGTQFAFLNGLYTATLTGAGATSDYTLNLPANAGSNGQVLTTDGSGNLSWTTAAGSYGNSNVATFLANYGSNTISTTGNITAGNLIGNISITGNVTGTSPNVSLVAGSYTYTFDNTGILTLPTGSSGNEGGEIAFTQAANSTLAGNTVVVDQYVDQIRFFESGGNTRGVYIDLTKAPAGVGGELQFKASAFVNAGVDVTLGNLRARIPTSGNRSLQISTVSGTYTVVGSAQFTAGGTVGGANVTDLNVTTTPTYLSSINNFTIAGDSGHWFIMDNTAGFAWRISFIIGSSYNNNMITIERMV